MCSSEGAGMGSSYMNMARIATIVVWVCLLFLTCEARGRHTVVSDLKRQLELTKENTIKTIKTAMGDVFDCVDIYKQPGLAHPKLTDHEIQMMPTMVLQEEEQAHHVSTASAANVAAAVEGEEECPQGSVPIRRLELHNLIKEQARIEVQQQRSTTNPIPKKNTKGAFKKFWAVTRTAKFLEHLWYSSCCDVLLTNTGGGATLNLYSVPDVGPDDVSASLMWIISEDGSVVLRAGWQVRPGRYNDTYSRLFIEWTADGDQTNCMDTDCPGFVVVAKRPRLGTVYLPVSTYMGLQYVIPVFIYKDPNTSNWWFAVGDKKSVIGYWPKELFHDFDKSFRIDYGGFAACLPNQRCPQIGNGVMPGAFNAKGNIDYACYVKDVHYYNKTFGRVNLTKKFSRRRISDYACCDVGIFQDAVQGFTFGGPAY